MEAGLKKMTKGTRTALLVAVLVPVVAISLPLAVFAGFAARLVLLVVIPLTVLALVVSPSVRRWVGLEEAESVVAGGLRMRWDVMFHPAHSWARVESDGRVSVGADDFMQRALGPLESVELPAVGREVLQGEPLFRIRRGDRTVDVRAPVSGTVLEANPALAIEPARLNQDPFGDGWVVRLRAPDLGVARSLLLRGNAARTWLRREVDGLLDLVAPSPLATPTARDGGPLVPDFGRHIDDAAWRQVQTRFFGHGHA